MIKQGTEYMKQGHSMVVFPEGTRNQTDTLLPFREGGYKMAEKSKSPIVPVSICRSDLMLESAPKRRIHSHSFRLRSAESDMQSFHSLYRICMIKITFRGGFEPCLGG